MTAKEWIEQERREDEERRVKFMKWWERMLDEPGKVGDTIKVRLPERYR